MYSQSLRRKHRASNTMTALEMHSAPASGDGSNKETEALQAAMSVCWSLFLRAFGQDFSSRFNSATSRGEIYDDNGAKSSPRRTERYDTSAHGGFSTIETRCS